MGIGAGALLMPELLPLDSVLAFPPLLKGFIPAGRKTYPGGTSTWKKAYAPRPLRVTPSEKTMQEMAIATGHNWRLLQETTGVGAPDRNIHTPMPRAQSPGNPLYQRVFPGGQPPSHNQWDYCKKYGRAPKNVPAPQINDMAAWFGEYGRPGNQCGPGFRSEFSATLKSVPRSEGETSAGVRMIKGRVLR